MTRAADVPFTAYETKVSAELLDCAIEIGPTDPRAAVFREIRTKLRHADAGSIPLRELEIRAFAVLLDCAGHHDYAAATHRAMTRIYVKLRHAELTEDAPVR
jgi:hypothetical protein